MFCTAQVRTYVLILLLSLLLLIILGKLYERGMHACHRSHLKIIGQPCGAGSPPPCLHGNSKITLMLSGLGSKPFTH